MINTTNFATDETLVSAVMLKVSTLIEKRTGDEPCAEAEADLLHFLRTRLAAPQAVQAAVPLPLLVRDIARDLGITVPQACIALKPLGNYSTNSAVTAEMARMLRDHFPAPAHPTQQGLDALTPAARDVLAERQRQIETEGWKTERDDVYDTGEIALAAACYAAHSASCAAIKAPHTAPGVFVRTRSAQDFVGEMWPWSEDWWKPSGHRRNLEKAGALILAEIERIDRATLAAQTKHGEAQQ